MFGSEAYASNTWERTWLACFLIGGSGSDASLLSFTILGLSLGKRRRMQYADTFFLHLMNKHNNYLQVAA